MPVAAAATPAAILLNGLGASPGVASGGSGCLPHLPKGLFC